MSRKDDIITELKSSFDADTTRSKIGRVREIYDVIVELKDGGMSLKSIVDILNKPDFNLGLDPATLASYLYMIRKKRGLERVVLVKQATTHDAAPKAVKPKRQSEKAEINTPAARDRMDKTQGAPNDEGVQTAGKSQAAVRADATAALAERFMNSGSSENSTSNSLLNKIIKGK